MLVASDNTTTVAYINQHHCHLASSNVLKAATWATLSSFCVALYLRDVLGYSGTTPCPVSLCGGGSCASMAYFTSHITGQIIMYASLPSSGCARVAGFGLLMHRSLFLDNRVRGSPFLLWQHRGRVELQRQWRLSLFSQPAHTTLNSASLHPIGVLRSLPLCMPSWGGGAHRVYTTGTSSRACPGGCRVVVSSSRRLSLWRVGCFSPLLQAPSFSVTLYLSVMRT